MKKIKYIIGGMITKEFVELILMYCPGSGVFVWKARPESMFKSGHACRSWNTRHAGKIAGTEVNTDEYIKISIFKKRFYAHRLAWLLVHGEMPKNEIDHQNGKTGDNRIENLRDVPHSKNQKNMKMHSKNKTGVCGVHWDKRTEKWRARIGRKHLGIFDDFEEAVNVRREAEDTHEYHKNHGRVEVARYSLVGI